MNKDDRRKKRKQRKQRKIRRKTFRSKGINGFDIDKVKTF